MTNIWLRGRRRSSVQIATAVLRLSDTKDTTKSELIDCVKMSHKQIQKYLKWLVDLQLLYVINTEDNHCRYRSTQKGQNLVSIVDEVQHMLVKQPFPSARTSGSTGKNEIRLRYKTLCGSDHRQ